MSMLNTSSVHLSRSAESTTEAMLALHSVSDAQYTNSNGLNFQHSFR